MSITKKTPLALAFAATFMFVAPSSVQAASLSSGSGRATVNAGGVGVFGTVVDKSGSPVAGAKVSVRNRTAGQKTFTMGTTNSKGIFNFKATAKKGDVVDVVIIWTERKGKDTYQRRITGVKVTL